MNVGEGQHATCMNGIAEVTDVGEDYILVEPLFYNFSQIRSLQKFSAGKICPSIVRMNSLLNMAWYRKLISRMVKYNLDGLISLLMEKRRTDCLKKNEILGAELLSFSSIPEFMYTDLDAFFNCVETRSTGQKDEYEIILMSVRYGLFTRTGGQDGLHGILKVMNMN